MHQHNQHSHQHDNNHNEKTLKIAITIILVFMIIEIIGSIISSSLILIADAGHMLVDAVALIMALYAIKIAKKAPDNKRSYGYLRSQVIAALINSITLFATTFFIIIEAIDRIIHPKDVDAKIVIALAIIGIIINLVIIFLLRGSKEDINMKSALVHVIGDLLGYIAAVITGVIVLLKGYREIDPILSLFFALVILRSAWTIAKDSTHILMEGTPNNIDIEQVKDRLQDLLPQIVMINDIHLWSLVPGHNLFTTNLSVSHYHEENIQQINIMLEKEFSVKQATIGIKIYNES